MISYKEDMVSIIVPVCDVQQYLKRCIDSILNQTYKNIELLLVDDGSTDKSGKICDEYQSSDTRVKVFHKANGGPSSARNLGLDRRRGGYTFFVDSDDWIEPKCIETLINLEKTNHVSIAGCAVITDYENGTHRNNHSDRQEGLTSGKECVLDILYQTKHAWGAMYAKLFKSELLDNVRFPLVNHLEDYAVSVPLFLNCNEIYFCKTPLYHYTARSGSLSKAAVSEDTLKSIDTAVAIKNNLIKMNADKEIVDASNALIFILYSGMFWLLYKKKPLNWKKMIQNRKKESKVAFRNYMFHSKRQKGDAKRILQYLIAIS